MESKEAVKLARLEFEKDFKDGEETNQWLTSVIEGLKQAEKDLEILNILKKYLFIKIFDKPTYDGTYYIELKNQKIGYSDHIGSFVSIHTTEQEKNLLKEIENDE